MVFSRADRYSYGFVCKIEKHKSEYNSGHLTPLLLLTCIDGVPNNRNQSTSSYGLVVSSNNANPN